MNDLLSMIIGYAVGLGPLILFAVLLGCALPMLFATSHPARWLVAVAVLFLSIGPISTGDASSSAEGSLFRQLSWGLVFLVSAFFVFLGKPQKESAWRLLPMAYVILLLFALTSVTWSEIPWISFKRVIQLFGVPLIAIAVIRNSTSNNALAMFAWPGAVFLALGFVAMTVPSFAFDTDGNFRGMTSTKNVWAQFAMLMALIYLYEVLHGSKAKIHWWLFGMATLSLLATRSTTGLVIYVVAVFILSYGRLQAKYGNQMVIVAIALVLAAILVSFVYFLVEGQLPIDALFKSGVEATGKDLTLTGRTALWDAMHGEIARHPWLGSGYGGFWTGLDGPSASIVREFVWGPGQAHSGYIDVANELGVVGIGLFFAMLLLHLKNILKIHRTNDYGLAVLHLAVLVAALLMNYTESNFMRTTHMWWIALSISIISTHIRAHVIPGGKSGIA